MRCQNTRNAYVDLSLIWNITERGNEGEATLNTGNAVATKEVIAACLEIVVNVHGSKFDRVM